MVFASLAPPRHPITSTCTLHYPFYRLIPSLSRDSRRLYRRLGSPKNLNTLRRIGSTSSVTFIYTDFTKESGKRVVSRAHFFLFEQCDETPIIRIGLPLLTVLIPQGRASPLWPLHPQSCRDADYIYSIYPEDEIQAAEGEHLMYRSRPEFTAKRLAMAKSAPKAGRTPTAVRHLPTIRPPTGVICWIKDRTRVRTRP